MPGYRRHRTRWSEPIRIAPVRARIQHHRPGSVARGKQSDADRTSVARDAWTGSAADNRGSGSRRLHLDAERAGPPFRLIVRSGIPVGGGTDATVGHPLNPWYSIYYMVSGKNVVGDPINAEHTITRMEALRLYTIGSAWFSHDADELGSLEVGKYGDIIVLSDDYFEMDEVDIQNLSSALTVVGGEVVHAIAEFQ